MALLVNQCRLMTPYASIGLVFDEGSVKYECSGHKTKDDRTRVHWTYMYPTTTVQSKDR